MRSTLKQIAGLRLLTAGAIFVVLILASLASLANTAQAHAIATFNWTTAPELNQPAALLDLSGDDVLEADCHCNVPAHDCDGADSGQHCAGSQCSSSAMALDKSAELTWRIANPQFEILDRPLLASDPAPIRKPPKSDQRFI